MNLTHKIDLLVEKLKELFPEPEYFILLDDNSIVVRSKMKIILRVFIF